MLAGDGGDQRVQPSDSDPATGCPAFGSKVQDTPLLPATNTAPLRDAVGNRDGTKVAFKYDNRQGPDAAQHNGESLYIVAADGTGQPTKVNLPNLTETQLANMKLLKWL